MTDLVSLPRAAATPVGIGLGPIDQIADGKARAFVIQMKESRFHGFVVRKGSEVFGYVDRCPHAGLPLAQKLDDYLTPNGDMIACTWHGALFAVDDGACLGGPCYGQRLSPWPVEAREGSLYTA